MGKALLIVDVQAGMYGFPEFQPYKGEDVITSINALIEKARTANRPVVFVQHAGRDGHPLHPDTAGFSIDPRLARQDTDPVVVKKHCAAFHNTSLIDALEALKVTHLVICGLQTDHCVDSAVRVGVDRGYRVTIAKDAHSTYDTEYMSAELIIKHHEAVWADSFGPVKTIEDIEFSS